MRSSNIMSTSFMPAPGTMSTVSRNVLPSTSSVSHPILGQGIKVVGTETLSSAAVDTVYYTDFANFLTTGCWFVNPANLPTTSRLYWLAYPWSRFRFTKLRLRYMNAANNGFTGTAVMCYAQDPSGGTIGNSSSAFVKASETIPNCMFTLYNPYGAMLDVNPGFLRRSDLLFIDSNATPSDESYRQAYQGSLQSWNDQTGTGGYHGIYYLDYEVELFGPRPPVDVALQQGFRRPSANHPVLSSHLSEVIKNYLPTLPPELREKAQQLAAELSPPVRSSLDRKVERKSLLPDRTDHPVSEEEDLVHVRAPVASSSSSASFSAAVGASRPEPGTPAPSSSQLRPLDIGWGLNNLLPGGRR